MTNNLVEYTPRINPDDPDFIKPGEHEDCEATALADTATVEYCCTRDKGHEMPHVAHGVYDQIVASWMD